MAEQVSDGKERGESPGMQGRFDLRLFASSLAGGRYLPIIYLIVFLVLSLFLFPPMQKIKDVRFRKVVSLTPTLSHRLHSLSL